MSSGGATEPSTPRCWDHLIGEPLDPQFVRAARDLDVKFFQKMQVYRQVPIAQAKEGGYRFGGAHWVFVKEADETHLWAKKAMCGIRDAARPWQNKCWTQYTS